MILLEVIIRAHTHIRSAELAVTAGNDGAVIAELGKLRELLNDQPVLEAGGAPRETPGPGDASQ